MELRQLRYLLAIAEERHFGRAAERLQMAQPPLSRQIQALEAELGFPLFDRSRRRVELTPAGVVLTAHARRVFEALELGVREAGRAAAGETGRIAVGYPSSLAVSGLAEVLRAFRERSPSVEVELREMTLQEQVQALRTHHIDVGFVRGPTREPGLELRLVRSEPLLLALPTTHRLASRAEVALAELAADPFVCFPREVGPVFFDRIMRLCHEAGFVPRIAQHAVALDMVSLVSAGFGVAILPGSMRLAHRPGAVFLAIEGAPTTELYAAWRPDDTSPVLRDFLQVVGEVDVCGPASTPGPNDGKSSAPSARNPSRHGDAREGKAKDATGDGAARVARVARARPRRV